MTPTIVVAGVSSGVGKTTVATGLMAAFTQRGLRVQAFKVGPDYIDPTYHTAVTGRPSRTLDGWLLSLEAVADLFTRAAVRADLCIIEGMMGLFDGRTGGRGAGSTAEIAALLNAPVLLVVDAAAIARSAAALVHGYRTFDPAVRVVGVVLNQIASEGHYRAVAPPIEAEAGVSVLGSLGPQEALAIPERYLGLVPATEGPHAARYFTAATAAVTGGIDLDRVLRLAETAGPVNAPPVAGLFPSTPPHRRARVAVARDRAFSFYYADTVDLLEAWGMELLPFSPLDDATLPAGAQGVYIGGGFPELFAAELAANSRMLASLRQARQRGIPVYAECGGYMYLGRALVDAHGQRHALAGLLPMESSMECARLTLGYREVRSLHDGPVAPRGALLRGHEFHWSVAPPAGAAAAYTVLGEGTRPAWQEGAVAGSVWGSYIHLHFGSDVRLAPHFVAHCSAAEPLPTSAWRPAR